MDKKSRLLVVIASLILALVFMFPIWNIDLNAPQYPEGLGLRIWVNQISGLNEHDLDTINELNHYIGMKRITPDSIKELTIMPAIVIFMILFGLFSAWKKSRKSLFAWLILFLILGIVGLVDFYLWEYNYGHVLSPDAPIKVPGMAYQPPLIGTKKLLNITAFSFPAFGSFIIFISILINAFVLWREKKLRRGK